METISINVNALRQLLQAVCGPSHYIHEMQATRGIDPGNPINVLLIKYDNAVFAKNNETTIRAVPGGSSTVINSKGECYITREIESCC